MTTLTTKSTFHREFEGKSSLKPLWSFTGLVVLIAILVPTLLALGSTVMST